MTHVLIVEDQPVNLEVMEEILVEYGITFMSAQSIDEAVLIGTTHNFDVVLMDMNLPQRRFEKVVILGGLEAVRLIRLHVDAKELPIVACTCLGMPDIKQKIISHGITQIVEKSIDFEFRIVRALEAVLGKKLSSAVRTIETTPVASVSPIQLVNPAAAVFTAEKPVLAASIQSDKPRFKDNDNEPLKPSNLLEPTTSSELRKLVADHLASVAQTADRLMEEAIDTDRATRLSPILTPLTGKLTQVLHRLIDVSEGPTPRESYGHWIVNLLLGIDRDVKKLKRLEDKDHFGSWTTDFAMMEAHLEQAFRAAKSPAGQECVPPIPMPIPMPMPKPESLAAPLKQKDGSLRPPMKKREIAPEQRLILIVDDNPEARRDLEEKLQQLRYRVVSCGNAAQALMFIETMRFDVCLVDLDMPEINGLELIQKIRDSKTSSDSSIIVVSGSPDLFNASDAIDGGADDYLEKPANALFLQARIRSCLRQSDSRLAELSRFLPEDVAKRVSSNRELLETAVPADISVMVCDIRGFSRISERVGPMRTIKWISDVMNELSKIILNRGGTIIDYVGDEIMAMWGAPIASQDHATEACRCALAVQKAVAELSEKWLPIVGSPMAVGVGINSGLAVVGNTGSKDRIKFGPLGNTVNMASRVQGATKYLQSSVLITHETAGRIDSNLRGRKICAVRVQNIMEPVELYELSEEGTEEISPKLRLYAEALAAYEKQDLNVAIALLARLMTESPEDGPAKLLMMRVIQSQLGGGTFDPIWTLPGK